MQIKTHVKGHGRIIDNKTGEVLLDKFNAIHSKNLAIAIARGLSASPVDGVSGLYTNQIYKIKLGNGGTSTDSMGVITFNPPNVSDSSAALYNETYSEIVDANASGAPAENSVAWMEDPTPDSTSTVVVVTAIIAADEPSGQLASDAEVGANLSNNFAFDEMGLFTSDDKLLTHLVFAPLLKTANRELALTYTLVVTVD